MKFKILLLAAVLVFFAAAATAVFALETCVPIYGGGQVCAPIKNKSFAIKKEVRLAGQDSFVDSLDNVKDNQVLEFRVTVKNTGEVAVDTLNVKDSLPAELALLAGQNLTWSVVNLQPLSENSQIIKVTTGNLDLLSSGERRCVVNTAEVSFQGQTESSDTATICLKKGQIQAVSLPATGAENYQSLLGILGLAATGFLLTKKLQSFVF